MDQARIVLPVPAQDDREDHPAYRFTDFAEQDRGPPRWQSVLTRSDTRSARAARESGSDRNTLTRRDTSTRNRHARRSDVALGGRYVSVFSTWRDGCRRAGRQRDARGRRSRPRGCGCVSDVKSVAFDAAARRRAGFETTGPPPRRVQLRRQAARSRRRREARRELRTLVQPAADFGRRGCRMLCTSWSCLDIRMTHDATMSPGCANPPLPRSVTTSAT